MVTISKKMCLVGDFGVGKTSLIRQFMDRQFSDQYLSTVGVKISRKLLELSGLEQQAVNLQLLVWDLEGHTKFKAVTPSYLQGASGAVIVADVTRQETIERIKEHVQVFLSINPKASVIVALNKSDLVDEEKLIKLLNYCQFKEQKQVLAIYSASAKTGRGVDEIFQKLAYKMVERHECPIK